jgi:Methyltransferase domain
MEAMRCRLCSAATEEQFQLNVLHRHSVTYSRCVSCGSLQTEEPYWLHESYTADVPDEDPAYLYRNLEVARNTRLMLHLFGLPRSATVLDFGGGLGIVARLLVESGWRAFVHDTFTDPPFPGLKWTGDAADFILSSEVLEHLTDPATELDALFRLKPTFIYVRTSRYNGEGSDWYYLVPETGQHIFFYTDEAMRMIAQKYGYQVWLPTSTDAIFSKTGLNLLQRAALKALLSRGFHRLKVAAAGM